MRRHRDLTPDAVLAVLGHAGFQAAEMEGSASYRRPVTEGVQAFWLPVTHEDRVAVAYHASPYQHADSRSMSDAALEGCAAALEAAGYQAEYVTETFEGYLVVWVKGEF